MSYDRRKVLRRSLLEKEFSDDYSLIPKVSRQGRDFGPEASQLLDTVTAKRLDTEQRHDTLEQARIKTAKLDPLTLLEDAIKSASQENDDAEYNALMSRYHRGDHILRNKAKEEMADAELEGKLYTEAANVFSQSQHLSDYSTQKVGEVVLPPITQHYANSLNRSTKYIKNMKDRMYLDAKLRQGKVTVTELQDAIDIKEKEIAEISVSIELSDRVGDFDWHLIMNNKIRSLTGHLDVDKEDLAHAQEELRKTEELIAQRYPDMSAQMSLGVLDQQSKIMVKPGTDPLDETNLTCINAGGEEVNLVYGWLLGKMTPKRQVCTLLFGQFTQKTVPPRRGWKYIGTNVKMDDSLQEAREEEGQATGVSPDFMLQMQHDKLKIKNEKASILTTEVATGKKVIKKILAVVVKGCTQNEVNGRYLEQGFMNNSQIFANVNGWTITRQQLQEIPEMDIYADGCYAPATLESGGDTISARMYNRTSNVITELLKTNRDGSDGLQAGSAAFKRRFAELARVGNRMVVADHQNDLIHTENIKAENRVQSDAEMLLRIAMATKQQQSAGNDVSGGLGGVEEEAEWGGDLSDDDDDDNMDTTREKNKNEQKDEKENSPEGHSVISRRSSQSEEESTVIDEGRDLPPDNIPTGLLPSTPHLNKTHHTMKKQHGQPPKASTKKFGRSNMNHTGIHPSATTTDNSPFPPKSTSEQPIPTAAESSAAFLITQETNTGKPVESYNNLDFKVMSTKNIQSQFGSQGFNRISKKTKEHVEEEADLSVQVIQTIELREDVLYQLKVEAADVQNRYITSHERSNIIDDEKALGRLIDILNDLRRCTVSTVEAIGAWARQASRLQDKEKVTKNYLNAKDADKANRKYAVVLSIKGSQLYPQSEAMQYTNNRRFRRQLEPAESAVEVKYVGIFDTKDEACEAFVEAAASVPIEQRYAPYVGDAPKMFIGLRRCGNHYMVRSVGVPPDLPCEQCGASKASNFKQFIPQATDKLFPQFLFHGENYLDKIWIDTQFLGTVMLMNHYFGQFDCFMNPLQLTKSKIAEVMEDIILFASDLKQNKDGLAGYIDLKPLNNLKGKYERFRVASEDALRRKQKPKEITIDGIAYRMPGKMPNLDSDLYQPQAEKFMSIDPHHLFQVEAQELKMKLQEETKANTSLHLEDFSFHSGQSDKFSEIEEFKFTTSEEYEGGVVDEITSVDERNAETQNVLHNRLKLAMSRMGVELEDVAERPSAVLQAIDTSAGAISTPRLQRAMIILGQSQALNQNFFKAQNVKNGNEMPLPTDGKRSGTANTLIGSHNMNNNKRMMSHSAGGPRNSKRGRNKDKDALVETVVQYTYFGAQLKTIQMRPKVAHRVDNVWVRSDQGEWYGTQTKGRHMKRFDRIERIVQEGKRRQEDRAELSRLILNALELDFVQGNWEHVKYIKGLIEKAAKHKGSVLDLDVLKAENYIRDRKKFILAVRFVQRCYRGFSMRKYVWYLREARRIKRLKMVLTAQEISKLAHQFVPNLLARVVASQTKILASKQFQIASNFGGVPMVVSVYAKPRGLRRSQNLCVGCQMRSQRVKYDPSKRKRYDDESPCYSTDRYPCSCTLIQGQECWLIEVYDPVSCKKYFKEFPAQQIQHHVFRTYYESQKLTDLMYHKHMLYGKDFGVMKPLFEPNSNSAMDSAFFESEGKYRLNASREYAVLGNIPRSFSEHLMYGMTHYKLTPELENVYASHLLKHIRRPICVQNTERMGGTFLPDDMPDEVAWQPIEDVLYAKHQFEQIKLIAPVMEKYMFKTRVEWEEWRDLLEDHRTGRYEQSSMEYEDMRSRLVQDTENLYNAELLVKEVMRFSLAGLEKIEAEERGEREDWNQAWEGLEDASRWQNLNNARKFRVKLGLTATAFDEMVAAHETVLSEHAHLVAEEARRLQLVNGDRSKIEALYSFLAQTQDCVLSIRKIALEALHVLVSTLIIPSRLTLESQKKLKFPPTLLPYIREPAKRAQLDYRAGWNIIARKFMLLRPLEAVGIHHLRRNNKKKQETVRCVITIYKDTLFANYIVSVRTSDDVLVKTEENVMHADFGRQKSDYSTFTSHTEDNEIMVSQEYIDKVLFAKPSNWPENRLSARIEDECKFFDMRDEEKRLANVQPPSVIGTIERFDDDDGSSTRPSSRGTSRGTSRNRRTLQGSNNNNNNNNNRSLIPSRPPRAIGSRRLGGGSDIVSTSVAAASGYSDSGLVVTTPVTGDTIAITTTTTAGTATGLSECEGVLQSSSSRPPSATDIKETFEVDSDSESVSGAASHIKSSPRPTSTSTSATLTEAVMGAPGLQSRRSSETASRRGSIRDEKEKKEEEKESESNAQRFVGEVAAVPISALLNTECDRESDSSSAISGKDDEIVKAKENASEITVHVKSIVYNKLACRSVPAGGYHSRHQRQARDQELIIAKLIRYLHLHPHSLRPCLGLLPFHRRQDCIRNLADKTIWYRDMIRKSNSSWLYSEFCKDKTAVVCQREFVATLRDSYGEVVLRLRTPYGGKEFGAFESEIVIPFHSIAKSMMTKPLLLAAFLCETITNNYSDDLVKHILGHIDLVLPGEQGRWWRRVLSKEKTPAIEYIDEDKNKYRGPIFSANKFVSGKYCNVQIFISATFDLKFSFSSPSDGMFWFQALKKGHEVTAIISNEAIKYFLLKKSSSAKISETEREYIVKLYHPLYIHGLIHYLLRYIEIKDKVRLGKYYYEEEESGLEFPYFDSSRNHLREESGKEVGGGDDSDGESEASGSPSLHGFEIGDSECMSDLSHDEDDADSDEELEEQKEENSGPESSGPESNRLEKIGDEQQQHEVEEIGSIDHLQMDKRMQGLSWRQRLRVKLWKCIKKFNLWVIEHNINITPLSSKFIAGVYTALREYECTPEWSLLDKEESEGASAPRLVVYDGFWPTVDPRLVVRKPIRVDSDFLALNSASVYSTSLVIDPHTGFNNYKKPANEIVFQGDAYYRVLVETDTYKSQVRLAVHETPVTDPTAESEVHRIEGEKMMLEDKASRASAELEVEMMLLREEATLRAATPAIPPEYLTHLVQSRDKNDDLKGKLRRLQHEFLPLIDGLWDKAALNSFALTTSTLAVSFDENKKQVFHIDKEAISNRCKKFQRFSQKDPNVTPTLSFFESIKPSVVKRAAKVNNNTVKAPKSTDISEVATENERITQQMHDWMTTLLNELRATKDTIAQPSIAFQQAGVSTKAYPGMGAPRGASLVDGLTSANGVNTVMSYTPTPFHENTYRTNVSWKRVRPLRHWELGDLVSLDADYLRRARKGTKPHYLRYKGQIFMVSAPNIGPADRSSVSVYSPGTGDSMVVGYKSNMKVPFIRGLKYFVDRDVYEEGGDESGCEDEVGESESPRKEEKRDILSDEESDLDMIGVQSDVEEESPEVDDTFPFESGIIRITKIQTIGLRSVVMVGKNDPYVCLSYGTLLATETGVAKDKDAEGGSEVSWVVDPDSEVSYQEQLEASKNSSHDKTGPPSEEARRVGHMNIFVTPADLSTLELHVDVMNVNKVSKPSLIGAGKVSLGAYLTSHRWEDKLAVIRLEDAKHRASGEVHIHFDFIEKHAPVVPGGADDPVVQLTREVAERVVWRAMVNGITVAAVKAAEVKLDIAYRELEKEIALKCTPWYRHQHQVTVVDKAGNLEYSSVLERKRTEEEKKALQEDPMQRQLLPSSSVATKTAHQDTHIRKLLMKKFEPGNFKRKVSLMYLDPLPASVPTVRAINTLLYGLFVPADEDISPTPFITGCNREWRQQCLQFLQCAGENYPTPEKTYTFPAIIYGAPNSSQAMTPASSSEQKQQQPPVVNLKLSKFIFEYIMQVGWRKAGEYMTHKKLLNHERTHRKNFNGAEASPTLYGDAVLLFRHGASDLELMQKWCQQRYVERLEMIERRRLKELHEHQMRINKFKLWRSDIYSIASKFGPLMENFFFRDIKATKFTPEEGPFNAGFTETDTGDMHSNSFVGNITHKRDPFAMYDKIEWRHLRLLCLRFSELLKTHPQEMKHSIQMMDQDYAFSNEERELLFESYNRSLFISGEEFLKFQWNTLHDPRNLQYQTGHILYALYLGHCEHCCVIPGSCPVPGCNIIKQLAHGHSYEYGIQRNTHGNNAFLALRGTGSHPLEVAAKKYLLELTTFETQFVFPTLQSPIVEVLSSEVSSVSSEFTKKALAKKSKRWRKQVSEAKKFRYLNRRVIQMSWRSFLTAEEVHEAKGGHDDREEKMMSFMETVKLSFYLPPPGTVGGGEEVGGGSVAESAYLYQDESVTQPSALLANGGAGVSSSLENMEATASLTVSTLAVRRMMGIHDENQNSFPVCSYDPAPARDELVKSWKKEGLSEEAIAKSKNCMSSELFSWLLSHVRVRRETPVYDPAKSLQGRGNSNLATAYDLYVSRLNDDSLLHPGGEQQQQLMFDRQLAQGVTYSMDNELIVLQVLQGFVPGVPKRQEANSGRPQAGKRFVSGEDMSALQEGLTVSVHHIDSDTTICLVIEDKHLDLVAKTFQAPFKNYPLIAQALLTHSADVIKLHLTDGMCKDVTLSVRLKAVVEKNAMSNLLMRTPLQDQYKHTNRRSGRINKQKGRLGAAAFLLDVLGAEEEEVRA